MTLLIFIGWGIILSSWIFAIFYFPGKYKIPNKGYFHVEDFWIRHIFEVMDDIEFPRPSWDQHVSGGGFLENLKLSFLRVIKEHVLVRRPLLCLQRRVIWFSKLCCFLSEKILFVCKIESLIIGGEDSEFAGFQEALKKVMLPGESQESLLHGTEKAFKQIKDFRKQGFDKGFESKELVHFLSIGSTDENSEGVKFLGILRERLSRDLRFDYLTQFSWKMTAISLLQLIIELEGGGADDAMKACSQAYDFFDLLDNPVSADKSLPELLVRAADKQYNVIKQQLDRKKAPSPDETATMQEARQKVRDLQENATSPNDSVDWWAFAANNSLEKVCTIILENDTSSETADHTELTNKVRRLLADILAFGLKEKVGKELVNNCREWAKQLEDEKIKASVYIAAKLRGVIAKLNEVMKREATNGDVGVGNFSAFNVGS